MIRCASSSNAITSVIGATPVATLEARKRYSSFSMADPVRLPSMREPPKISVQGMSALAGAHHLDGAKCSTHGLIKLAGRGTRDDEQYAAEGGGTTGASAALSMS